MYWCTALLDDLPAATTTTTDRINVPSARIKRHGKAVHAEVVVDIEGGNPRQSCSSNCICAVARRTRKQRHAGRKGHHDSR